MGVRDRVRKYRASGGAFDLVRVEVLVPAVKRDAIVSDAARMRAEHRGRKQRLRELLSMAKDFYGPRLLDNIDFTRLPDPFGQAPIIAGALMERGDARAFVVARRILAETEASAWS